MSVILLLRHGQASFGSENYDVLSPNGFRQSEVLGRSLVARGVQIDRAVSGTLARQRDTARTALDSAGLGGLDVAVDTGWDEYDHDGLSGGAAATDPRAFQDRLEVALAAWSAGTPDTGIRPEWPTFAGRVGGALRAVTDGLGSGETVAVFTSGGVISAVCAQLLALPPDAVVAFNRVTVNAAITKVVHGRRGSTLVSFNDHAHFEGPDAGLLTYR